MRADDDRPKECFRVYGSPEQSFRDHSDFLRYRDRYKFLFELKITDYKGSYQHYRNLKAAQAIPQQKARKEKKQREATPEAAKKKNTRNLEKRIAKLERDIEKQEALVSGYDGKIQAAATDYAALTALMAEKTEAEETLQDLYTQWETLSGELEA